MAKKPVITVALNEDELRFLIWSMRFMEGGVDKEADKKRLYLETLFEKALDFSVDPDDEDLPGEERQLLDELNQIDQEGEE